MCEADVQSKKLFQPLLLYHKEIKDSLTQQYLNPIRILGPALSYCYKGNVIAPDEIMNFRLCV